MISTNRGLQRKLGITPLNTSFQVPELPGDNLWVFADIPHPHMIKHIRNHFVDNGIVVNNKILNSAPLRRLLAADSEELTICHKVKLHHDKHFQIL